MLRPCRPGASGGVLSWPSTTRTARAFGAKLVAQGLLGPAEVDEALGPEKPLEPVTGSVPGQD